MNYIKNGNIEREFFCRIFILFNFLNVWDIGTLNNIKNRNIEKRFFFLVVA